MCDWLLASAEEFVATGGNHLGNSSALFSVSDLHHYGRHPEGSFPVPAQQGLLVGEEVQCGPGLCRRGRIGTSGAGLKLNDQFQIL